MTGLGWKRNAAEVLERRRRFFGRQMLDGILASLPINLETEPQERGRPGLLRENPGLPADPGGERAWQAFEAKWPQYQEGGNRPFPCDQEILERAVIGEEARGRVEDDHLPVLYSILDAGESMVGAMFGAPVRFIHRPRGAAFSKAEALIADYAELPKARFALEGPWTRRFLGIQDHFREQAGGRFAQYPCLTMDALNFVCELRGATAAYLDIYEHPDQLRQLMEIGLDFNIRFQEAQMERTGGTDGGGYVMLGQWAPFPKAIALSVDAYVICSPATYVDFGFEYQKRLIAHFGHGLMHFHCNRTDLAAEVARLPGLDLFQFGGDTRDPVPTIDRIPEMRRAVGDMPLQLSVPLNDFVGRLKDQALEPNAWYLVTGPGLSVDEANRLMDRVRAYRA